MAAVNISGQFLNKDKREHEAVVVTLPAKLSTNGGRTNPNPVYVQYADTNVASVLPAEIITGKSYLVVEEAFPAGTTATVTVGGSAAFTAVSVATTGITVSALLDQLELTATDVVITIGHVSSTGNVTTGKLRVVTDYIPYTVKNGRYAINPA